MTPTPTFPGATATPGPWAVEGRAVYALTDSGKMDKGEPVLVNRFTAIVHIGKNCEPGEAEATAQLMACAPAIRDALEDLLIAIGMGWDLEAATSTGREALSTTRTTLAGIGGESEVTP